MFFNYFLFIYFSADARSPLQSVSSTLMQRVTPVSLKDCAAPADIVEPVLGVKCVFGLLVCSILEYA